MLTLTKKQLFTPEFLYSLWTKGETFQLMGVTYRVGKMSYGDYFLEPGIDRGERAPFNEGTLWLTKVKVAINDRSTLELYEIPEEL